MAFSRSEYKGGHLAREVSTAAYKAIHGGRRTPEVLAV
jgi:hypothetical protein